MKKILLLIFLFLGVFLFGAKTTLGQTPYPTPTPTPVPTPPPGAGFCGDAFCDEEGRAGPVEACDQCVPDCGTCQPPGTEVCEEGICADGRAYKLYCSPGCLAEPRTCWFNNSCTWPPDNCNDFGPDPNEWCRPWISCGFGPAGCEIPICGAGGNCYVDCSVCAGGTPEPSPTAPPVCFDIPPTIPQLSSPLDGASNVNQDLLLDWDPLTSWGTNCAGNVNNYEVYLDSGVGDPTSLEDTVGESTTNLLVSSLTLGDTYSWKVVADNGVFTRESAIWSFTVTPILSAWWQSQDGDVHAEGFVTTSIPNTCTTPVCDPYASQEGTGGYPGVVSSFGSADFGDGSVSTEGWLANTGLPLTSTKYGYDPFYRRAGKPTSPAFTGGFPGDGVFYAGTSQTVSGPWTLSGQSTIIFVDGDLTINGNITVPVGSFLAFVVSGNITFGPSVSSAEGIYLADGTITTASSTTGFTGEGVFVGWSGFSLERDYGDVTNNDTPAEDFVWRPDLYIELLDTVLVREPLLWQEVAP